VHKMVVMDNYRKGWALRYIREAEAELEAAHESPAMAPTLILESLRKAQAAIYYSLGEPKVIEGIVLQGLRDGGPVDDPILRFLIEVERSIKRIERLPVTSMEEALKEADEIVRFASEIVTILTRED